MDLSQQELPLTAYFTRGSKSSAVARKKDKYTEQSVPRSSKRKRDNVRRSPTSPPGGFLGLSESRPIALQLPTPAASARKRTRVSEDLESRLASSGVLLSSDEHNPVPPCDGKPVQLGSGPTPSCSSCHNAKGAISEFPGAFLAMPSVDQRKTIRSIDIEFPPVSGRVEIGIATPQTSRRVSQPVHSIDHSPLAYSKRSLPNNCEPMPRDGAFVPLPQTINEQPLNDHAMPTFPVPSSQSQYLLHPDATPKRKQRSQCVEHVVSSQTQEERELTSSPLKPLAMACLPTRVSFGKFPSSVNVETPRRGRTRREGQHTYNLESSPAGSSANTPSRCFARKKAPDEFLSKSSTPSQQRTANSSPSRKTRTPSKLTCQNSIENIIPAHTENSVTESESDLDILRVKHRSLVFRDKCSVSGTGDDSATEAESDTEILRCVAEISRKQPRDRRFEDSEGAAPLPLLVSPLVSPARSRIATMPPVTQLLLRGNVETGISARSCTPYASTLEQPHMRSESLPSAVREFVHMFPGDESYPADFPESLRI